MPREHIYNLNYRWSAQTFSSGRVLLEASSLNKKNGILNCNGGQPIST